MWVLVEVGREKISLKRNRLFGRRFREERKLLGEGLFGTTKEGKHETRPIIIIIKVFKNRVSFPEKWFDPTLGVQTGMNTHRYPKRNIYILNK